ncbi:MAG: NAD-dependent epimerase/dehydratase family protein [Thiohalocapsa sp.]|nr:NAD-dependent epimerase/dehydratase family protein [Thiohalocapsa sp.]MCF7990139.1 NAD-dependent epimerase/dehydratase family protein [Thiohalocapsa sp.]
MGSTAANRNKPSPTRRPLVLITGSAGLIGTRLAAALGRHFDVVGLDLRCTGTDHDCREVDLTSDESLEAVLDDIAAGHGTRVASVIHLAAYFDLTNQPHPLYERLNVGGTRRLLQALRRKFDVEQFVYAGTMLVHAPTEPGVPITESSPLEAKWIYPRSKLAAEAVVAEEHGDIPAVLLRIAGLYTNDCGSAFVAHQIQRIYERRLTGHLYAGDPARGQAMIHIDDLVELVERLVERREQLPAKQPGGASQPLALLAGEPAVMTYEALQNRLGELLHGEQAWRTRSVPHVLAQAGAWVQEKTEPAVPDAIDRGEPPFIRPFMAAMSEDHYEIDIGRARGLLDWSPQHRIRDTLPEMVDALQADPPGWYARHKLAPPQWMQTSEEEGYDPAALKARFDETRRTEHDRTRWAHFLNIGLGGWVLTSPPTLGYTDPAMTASDIATGLWIILFATLSLSRQADWARLATAAAGIWLTLAPLVFWTPSAAAYLNGTLVGALVFCLAIVVAPMPGIAPMAKLTGPDIPRGWSYSPSAWTQRLPVIALAFVGLYISRYLAAYQLGHTPQAWDPFFGDGTERVITSSVSEAWPVPDAGLGGFTYLLEILTGLLGGRARWRTMPWVVVLFGILIVPLGAVSIFFIVIQPIVIGTWCSLCLVAALAMLIQIPYSYDELLATGQFLAQRRRQGKPLLRVFLFGDTADGTGADQPSEDRPSEFDRPARAVLGDIFGGGVSLPWTLAVSTLLGVWLMCTRLIFDTAGAQAHSDHLLGALVVSFSVAALGEAGRSLRLFNLVLGMAVMGAPWMLDGGSLTADVAGVAVGAVLIALAIPRGRIRCRYGDWDKFVI